MNARWLPNAITLARMAMALPLLWLLMHSRFQAALWLAVVAGSTDMLDGLIARRYGWQSALGGILDPLADKLLLTVCFLGLWWSQHLPTWLVAVVLIRDLVILLGAFAWWRLTGPFKASPTGISKITTLTQIVLIALVLAHLAGYSLAQDWVPPLVLATAAATLVSGFDYVICYGLKAWRARGSGQ